MNGDNRRITSLAELGEVWWHDRERVLEVFCRFFGFDPQRPPQEYREYFDRSPIDLIFAIAGSVSIPGFRCVLCSDFNDREAVYDMRWGDSERYERDLNRLHKEFWRLRDWYRQVRYEQSPNARMIPPPVVAFLQNQNLEKYQIRVSEADPAQWQYTPDEAAAKADRQIRMRPGKLLRKLLPDIAETVVQAIATAYTQGTVEYPLQFATTRPEVKRVYENGPSSCMGHSAEVFGDTSGNSVHPAEAYASEDCAVAFIEDFTQRITARAAVNLKKKLYARIYGNTVAMQRALDAAGYSFREEALDGCRLLKLVVDDKIICPYPDGMSSYEGDYRAYVRIKIESDHLLVTRDAQNKYRTDTAVLGTWDRDGCSHDDDDDDDREHMAMCEFCDDEVDQDDLCYVDGPSWSGDVCDGCRNNSGDFHFAIVGGPSLRRAQQGWLHRRDATYVDCLHEWFADDLIEEGIERFGAVHSDYHDRWIPENSAVYIERLEAWVDAELVDVVTVADGESDLKEDCVELHNGDWVCRESADLVHLSDDYSEKAGKWALREDVRPALGADADDCTCWVLEEEVIEYAGMEFYRRDCVKVPLSDMNRDIKWVPLIATFRTEEGTLVEAQLELAFRDEVKQPVPVSEPELEEEECV